MSDREKLISAFNRTIDLVLAKGCPCAFPRVHFVLTFDPEKFGVGPRMLEITQALIQKFVPPKGGGVIGGLDNEEKTCRVCGSGFQLKFVEYSLTMNYVTLECTNLKARAIGAPVIFPVPIAGRVLTWNEVVGEDLFRDTFANVTEEPERFFNYMTELAKPLDH